MNRIVLFGTGNLGKRYIQAVSGIGNIELLLFDISETALQSVPRFLEKNNISDLNYRLLNSFEDAYSSINENSTVIISSTLTRRLELLQNILKREPKALVCEKPVVQTNTDYLILMDLLQVHKIPTFVDFTLRMQPFYRKIKEEMGTPDSGIFLTNLPKTGLACVGIHQIDLFFWIFNLTDCNIITSTFKSVYEQKRAGFYDVVGSLILEKSTFKAFIINDADESLRTAQIIAGDVVYNVHEDQRIITKVHKTDNKLIINENIEYLFVSKYMTGVISNIISENYDKINLPSIENSYHQHKVLFDYFLLHSITNLNFT